MRIATDSDVLTKGRPILRLPRFPAHVTITVGPLLDSARAASPEALTAEVAAWYRGAPAMEAACPAPVAALS